MTRKRLRSLIAFSLLMALVLAGGILLRNFFLGKVRDKIQSVVSYDRIRLRVFPPSLVMDNVQTISRRPFFSARQVKVGLPFASLFKSEKPLTVVIEQPVVRIEARPEGAAPASQGGFSLGLPFVLKKALLRDGEFFYKSSTLSFQAGGIHALFQDKGDGLSAKADFRESSLLLGPDRRPLEGRMRLQLEAMGNRLLVNRFTLDGPDAIIKARGMLTNLRDPQGTLRVTFRAGMSALADILDIPFRWRGRLEGEGKLARVQKEITYLTSFESDSLVMNEVVLGKAKGRVEYKPRLGFSVAMDVQRKTGAPEEVRILSEKGKVRGDFKSYHLDPILSYFQLPWPVHAASWGRFVLDDRKLTVDLEFRDAPLQVEPGRYPMRGQARLTWDRKQAITFSLPQLETSFGQMDVNGMMSIGGDIDVSISGDYQDVRAAREFTSLVMSRELDFPEIRGQGHVDAHIGGTYSAPRVRLDFALSPAGFGSFDVASGRGFVEIVKERVLGQTQFDDPSYKGEITFLSAKEGLDVEVKLARGAAEKILPRLGLNFPLEGSASGYFQVNLKGPSLRVEGTFSGPRLKFGFATLGSVSGRILWDSGVLSFPELAFDLYGGRIKSAFGLDIPEGRVEIKTSAENIDLSALHPRLAGQLSLEMQGRGNLNGDFAAGTFAVKNLSYPPIKEAEAAGKLRLSFADDSFGVTVKGDLRPGENDFSFDVAIPLSAKDISVDGKGSFSNLELFLPWKGARGRVNFLAELRGLPASPRLGGAIDFEGPILPIPRFAQALTDYAGLIFVQNNRASIRSFKAKLGGGNLQGSGEILLGGSGLENIRLTLEGENLLLSPLERTRALVDASLRLVKDESLFSLEGNLDIKRLSWRREVFEALTFSSSPYPSAEREPGIFDALTLNLRMRADDNAWMENSLGRIRGRFDLTIAGNVRAPILLGEIEALGGEAYFQDRKFDILRGRVSFFNPAMIEPYLNFRCETYVKDYRVTLSLTGLASQLRPEFTSSPPLPPEDVLALLALGEAFRRPYSAEASSQIGTASLLSFQLTEEAQRRAEKLFSLDRFRIDPFLMGSLAEMTARLTVGKKISRDFYIYYSTNLTRQTEEIIRLEWDLGNEFSLVGTRNELGRVSLDFKIRKRF